MKIAPHHQTACWLIISSVLLSSLIPGGPVENRDFSHIHPIVLAVFNVFLTTLDLGSLVLAYFAWKKRSWAFRAAFSAGVAYFAVYAVDLAQLFPRSPTPMSFSLALIEVMGMTASVPLMFASRRSHRDINDADEVSGTNSTRYAIALALTLAGIGIIWFATDAAMGGSVSLALPAAEAPA